MAANLMNVFKNTDLKNVGKSMSDVVSLAFKPNKKTGAKIARAVLSDGTTLIKSVAVKCVDIRRNTSGEGGLLDGN